MDAIRLADSTAGPTLHAADITQLRQAIRGELVLPDDSGYARARSVWNGMIDKTPAAIMTGPSGDRFFSISACYVGPIDEGERLLKPLRDYGVPVEDRIAPTSYLQIQSAGDSIFPRGRRYYWKAQFMRDITYDAIDVLLARYACAPAGSLVVLQQVGGAIARIPIEDTPYANRDALYDCFPISIWNDSADDEAQIRWARDLWDAMRPFSTGGVYANNLGEEGADRIRAAYGENYPRLVAVKNKYDPANFFRLNQNIRPSV